MISTAYQYKSKSEQLKKAPSKNANPDCLTGTFQNTQAVSETTSTSKNLLDLKVTVLYKSSIKARLTSQEVPLFVQWFRNNIKSAI